MALAAGLCCALLASLAAGAQAEGTWQSLAPLPEATEGLSAANVGNRIVAAYGDGELLGDSTQTLIYNIADDSWSSGPNAPGPGSAEGIAVSHGDSVYALGGRNGAGTDNNRFTPETETWTTLAPLPKGRDGLGAAVVGNSIYAVGGRPETGGPCSGSEQFADVERYDIASNTWSTVAPLPTPRSDVGAIAHGGKIYVFGGCKEGAASVTGEVDIYSRTKNSWSEGAPMPTPRAGFYGIGIKGDDIYVMGGLDAGGKASSANEVYDISDNSWSVDTPMTHPRGEMGVASHGGRIYTIGGGIPAFGTPQFTNDVFLP
jgi:N-acetylneuraminic acid mutarotase